MDNTKKSSLKCISLISQGTELLSQFNSLPGLNKGISISFFFIKNNHHKLNIEINTEFSNLYPRMRFTTLIKRYSWSPSHLTSYGLTTV